ncbi:MAG: hypothetical protein IJN31_02770, partial [Peptococcaceae bacterium]|nr:hypothetical protein [Peptococcaceae bacterium]
IPELTGITGTLRCGCGQQQKVRQEKTVTYEKSRGDIVSAFFVCNMYVKYAGDFLTSSEMNSY